MFGGAGTETAAQLTAATAPPLERTGRKVTGAAGQAAKGLSPTQFLLLLHTALSFLSLLSASVLTML